MTSPDINYLIYIHERTAPVQRTNLTAGIGKPGQDSQVRASGTGQLRIDKYDCSSDCNSAGRVELLKTVGSGQGRKERTGRPEHDSMDSRNRIPWKDNQDRTTGSREESQDKTLGQVRLKISLDGLARTGQRIISGHR